MPAAHRRRESLSNLAVITALLVAGLILALALGLAGNGRMPAEGDVSLLPGQAAQAPLLSAPPSLDEMDQARARNAAVPFFAGPVTPAQPFRFDGTMTDRERARDCLALAAMAEAGSGDGGQRAVVQVILNRVRHPAFAKTVCGVVFEGSQRATGCQFTFTCDGSLARQYGEAAWSAARRRADEALGGYVFPAIGTATHYHTDWVFPAWSPELVKLAQVDTHLFFRWPGYWGTAAALRVPYRGGEPDTGVFTAGEGAALPSPDPTFAPLPPDTPKVSGGQVAMRDPTGRANFMLLASTDSAQALANARKLCGPAGTCRVLGWSDASAIPATFPIPRTARAALQFSFTRDPAGTEIVLYNCDTFAGIARDRCIPRAR